MKGGVTLLVCRLPKVAITFGRSPDDFDPTVRGRFLDGYASVVEFRSLTIVAVVTRLLSWSSPPRSHPCANVFRTCPHENEQMPNHWEPGTNNEKFRIFSEAKEIRRSVFVLSILRPASPRSHQCLFSFFSRIRCFRQTRVKTVHHDLPQTRVSRAPAVPMRSALPTALAPPAPAKWASKMLTKLMACLPAPRSVRSGMHASIRLFPKGVCFRHMALNIPDEWSWPS